MMMIFTRGHRLLTMGTHDTPLDTTVAMTLGTMITMDTLLHHDINTCIGAQIPRGHLAEEQGRTWQ